MAKAHDNTDQRRFRVYARSTGYPYVDLDASSPDEATDIASRIDGFYFTAGDEGDWQILPAVEIAENEPFHPLDEAFHDTL